MEIQFKELEDLDKLSLNGLLKDDLLKILIHFQFNDSLNFIVIDDSYRNESEKLLHVIMQFRILLMSINLDGN